VGHVLFLYPTRATTTEGFRDYVSWAPEAEAALMHGTSEFDLQGMFDNDSDPRHNLSYEAERRLFALGYWGRRAFSATVDQFLAFLQYGYSPVCMLPVLADSVVVIDEVHSFDRNMFAALKKFLAEFDVPVLCMTATLPNDRRDELVRECGLTPYEDRPGDLATIASAPRYRLHRVASRDEAESAVRKALEANKRVLWVVNQVKRAHAVLERFVKELPPDPKVANLTTSDAVPVYCYHSRFKLTDRVARHKELMAALKDKPGPALGVTTQVCEMSLDIDVDLLVTEDCPVTALVQRMGRCNRAQKPRALGDDGNVLVYAPGEKAPYDDNDLTGVSEFLDLVKDRVLSQTSLEEAMRRVPSPASLGDPLCSFLESGPYAIAGEEQFRDSEEFNRPCVLSGEVGEYLRAPCDLQPGFVLPVPRKFARDRADTNPEHAELPGYLGVARAGYYHAAIGFCDRLLTEWRGK
jgi:CRISPR-associated endonuclease/helicase Cas3